MSVQDTFLPFSQLELEKRGWDEEEMSVEQTALWALLNVIKATEAAFFICHFATPAFFRTALRLMERESDLHARVEETREEKNSGAGNMKLVGCGSQIYVSR